MNEQFPRAGHFDETSVFNVPLVREFVEVVFAKPLLVKGDSFTLSFAHLRRKILWLARNSE
jgi:hypothetical protein